MRLKDRNRFPPGGYRYYAPQTNFSITPWVSFDAAVKQIIAHRQANPHQSQVNGWANDYETVANELDAFNSAVCKQMGWNDYIWEGGGELPGPKSNLLSQLRQNVRHVAAGVETIREWDIEGGTLVPQELAEQRALTCTRCAKNGPGDLTAWFTEPAAALIKRQLEARNQRKIFTAHDPELGICTACACPLKLKVHCPIEIINAKMNPDDRKELWEGCWILAESP